MLHRPTGFRVPARGALKLEPGGKHLMLIELYRPLGSGESVELTLCFEKAGTRSVSVPVHAPGAATCCGDRKAN